MEERKGPLTLKATKERKEANKRLLADGRYVLTGNPRRGGIATVYRALDTVEERAVAIKLFRASVDRDDIVEESFRRETQALSDLRHPNIVEILDSGIDEDTDEHYIAMEWIDQDLEAWRAKAPFRDWKQFYDRIGRQIIEAIAFAHTHATIHRDIKPSNILVTPEGVAKVCDFGISKIRNFLEPGVTLAQFASLPYAPPERDDGTYSYSRDVFGFAALSVAMLAPVPPEDHLEMMKALELLNVSDPTKRLLRRCLSLDTPADRPTTATVLLGELDRLTPKPLVTKQGSILLSVTNKVKDILNFDLRISEEGAVTRFIQSDLADARAALEPPRAMPDASASAGLAIRLFGYKYGYIAVAASNSGDKLRLVSALEFLTSQLEEHRDSSLQPSFGFTFSGIAPATSAENIRQLSNALVEFAADQKAALVERRRQAIYNTWLNLLNAKTELERCRRHKVAYKEWDTSGAAIRFVLPQDYDPSVLLDQEILIEVGNRLAYTGTVVSVVDDSIHVLPNDRNRIEANALPDVGYLSVDTEKTDAALGKQKKALESVRFGRSVNPSLGALITSPGDVTGGHPATIEFIQKDIDDDKRDAVQVAMSDPDLLLIQGPPGTGKTTFITELVLQILRRNPESRILLTSQTHVALDNSLERIAHTVTLASQRFALVARTTNALPLAQRHYWWTGNCRRCASLH